MAARKGHQGGDRGFRLGLVAGAAFAVLALGVRAATGAEGGSAEIAIQNFQFVPARLEVPAGATVTWVNDDDEVHAISSPEAHFSSPGLEGAQRFSYRFEKPGVYDVVCALHPQMKGTVVVR